MDALARKDFAQEWGDFRWRDYGFDAVVIPADLAGLLVGSVNCTGSGDGKRVAVTSVFTDLYDPGRNRKDIAALLLVGRDEPDGSETWESYLRSTFPGDWEFKRTGSVLIGLPRGDAPAP